MVAVNRFTGSCLKVQLKLVFVVKSIEICSNSNRYVSLFSTD